MTIESGDLKLSPFQELGSFEKNKALACKNADGTLYTILSVPKREDAEGLIPLLGIAKEDPLSRLKEGFWDQVSGHESFFLVLPYRKKRSLFSFWNGKAASKEEREEMAKKIVAACMDAHVPFPLLSLLLAQKNLQMGGDGEVFFCYDADLSDLSLGDDESRCALECARLLLGILDPGETKSSIAAQLLSNLVITLIVEQNLINVMTVRQCLFEDMQNTTLSLDI